MIRGLTWRTLLRMMLLLLATAVVMTPARANERAEMRIDLAACIKPVQPGDRAAALVGQPAAFDCTTRQTAFGPGDYWVRLAIPATVKVGANRLRWSSVWQNSAAVFAAYPDGSLREYVVPSAGSGRFVHVGAIYTVTMRREVVPHTVVVRIAGSGNLRGIMLRPHLASAEQVARTDVQRVGLYSGFAGLCLALLTYHLVMWRALKQPYLRAYGAMIGAGLFYAFTSSAGLAQLMPGIDNNVRLRLNYCGLAVMALCALWFVRAFLDSPNFGRLLDRFLLASGYAVGLTALAFGLFAPWQIVLLDQLHHAAYAMMFVIAVILFWRSWRSGGQIERIFVMAWAIPLIFNSMRALHGFGLLPHSFWLDNSTLLAMSMEALLSSMIIAYRMRIVHADRDAARADEAEARHQADTDDLTGLNNRRSLMRAVCPPPERAGLYRLVLIDIDHFKRINDAVGHSAGDAVLQRIARLIQSELRPGALAARLGGEEFAIIYPTDMGDRRYHTGLLERIRALVPVGGARLTVSMGAATGWLGGSEGEWLALYRAADSALYEAKTSGRDRLVVAPLYPNATAAAA
jgi:diguanylate cyclase (GGDEF)-like protein